MADPITPESLTPQPPVAPATPVQQSPFTQTAAPVNPVTTPAPAETVAAQPAAEVQPAPPVTAPVQPVAPVVPQAPAAPADTAPLQPAQSPIAPVQPAAPLPGGMNTTETIRQAQPTEGAFVPKAIVPERIANPTEEYYRENATQKAHHMRDVLHAQEKAWTMVPLIAGEKPGTMLPVGINGYFVFVRKGVMVKVPKQIAEMIAESFNLDYQTGADLDLSRNEDKSRALA